MLGSGIPKVVAIGEAMVELAPLKDALYQRGFAGDTYNTVWHIAQLLGRDATASFVTCVGQDKLSDCFVDGLTRDGLDVSTIGRDAELTMGLYLIELDGVERHFQYWRDQSAARRLADNPKVLTHAVDGANVIHISGITLAILSPDARETLFNVLVHARQAGARVSFDPNIRERLWRDRAEIRDTISRFLAVTDIALPSFDDEATHFGDTSPSATINRFVAAGIKEIAIKNGAGAVLFHENGTTHQLETPPVANIKDTTGAGDAFNAGYLAAGMRGFPQADAVGMGQALSAQVIQTRGALLPKENITLLKTKGSWEPPR